MTTQDALAPMPDEWLAAHPDAPAAQRKVVEFLGAMERRDLEAASGALGEGFAMVFPGPARYRRLGELVAASEGRYKRVAKRLEAVESFGAGGPQGGAPGRLQGGSSGGADAGADADADASAHGGAEVVWVRGTLYGENVHGVAFHGVRFVDRFEVAGGRLVRQDVWNDLAESGVLAKRP